MGAQELLLFVPPQKHQLEQVPTHKNTLRRAKDSRWESLFLTCVRNRKKESLRNLGTIYSHYSCYPFPKPRQQSPEKDPLRGRRIAKWVCNFTVDTVQQADPGGSCDTRLLTNSCKSKHHLTLIPAYSNSLSTSQEYRHFSQQASLLVLWNSVPCHIQVLAIFSGLESPVPLSLHQNSNTFFSQK